MNEIVPYEERIGALSVGDVRSQVNLIQHVMREVMQKDVHYGVIPGTGTKPTLYKAGAEKLCLTFRLDPQYEVEEKTDGDHMTVTVKCTLTHIPTGQRFGSGMGSCSTKESKYAYRKAGRKCPECGAEAIIKGRAEYGGGWLCFAKKGGCGHKWPDGAQAIESQVEGREPNPDVPDAWNTVLKMGCKRALVAAVLNTTAASDCFTQDIEDLPGAVVEAESVEISTDPAPATRRRGRPKAKPTENAPTMPQDDAGEAPEYWRSLAEATSLDELAAIWDSIPPAERPGLVAQKDARKSALAAPQHREII